jgi:hypothetical protein
MGRGSPRSAAPVPGFRPPAQRWPKVQHNTTSVAAIGLHRWRSSGTSSTGKGSGRGLFPPLPANRFGCGCNQVGFSYSESRNVGTAIEPGSRTCNRPVPYDTHELTKESRGTDPQDASTGADRGYVGEGERHESTLERLWRSGVGVIRMDRPADRGGSRSWPATSRPDRALVSNQRDGPFALGRTRWSGRTRPANTRRSAGRTDRRSPRASCLPRSPGNGITCLRKLRSHEARGSRPRRDL